MYHGVDTPRSLCLSPKLTLLFSFNQGLIYLLKLLTEVRTHLTPHRTTQYHQVSTLQLPETAKSLVSIVFICALREALSRARKKYIYTIT